MRPSQLFFAAIAVTTIPAQAIAAQDAANVPTSIKALHTLFSGKTWQWEDGAGYFRPDGGFIAYSGQGEKAAFVKGGWGVYSDGRLCFWGTWKTAAGNARKATCFRHTSKSGTVYQQKPNGEWYVFKNATAAKSDESNKVVAGDLASSQVSAIQKQVGEPSRKASRRKPGTAG